MASAISTKRKPTKNGSNSKKHQISTSSFLASWIAEKDLRTSISVLPFIIIKSSSTSITSSWFKKYLKTSVENYAMEFCHSIMQNDKIKSSDWEWIRSNLTLPETTIFLKI